MFFAAKDHSEDIGLEGLESATGSDGSTLQVRMDRFGNREGEVGESIQLGQIDGREALIALLVNDGKAKRDDRLKAFSKVFTKFGSAKSEHATKGDVLVVNYAQGYDEKTKELEDPDDDDTGDETDTDGEVENNVLSKIGKGTDCRQPFLKMLNKFNKLAQVSQCYYDSVDDCYTALSAAKNAIACASCDFNAATAFGNGKIAVKPNVLNALVKKCSPLFYMFNKYMKPLLNSINTYVFVVDKQKDDFDQAKTAFDKAFDVDPKFCVKVDDDQPKETAPSLVRGLERTVVSKDDRCYFSATTTVSADCLKGVSPQINQLLLYHDPMTDKGQEGMWKLMKRAFDKLATEDGMSDWKKFIGGDNPVVTDGKRLMLVPMSHRIRKLRKEFNHRTSLRKLPAATAATAPASTGTASLLPDAAKGLDTEDYKDTGLAPIAAKAAPSQTVPSAEVDKKKEEDAKENASNVLSVMSLCFWITFGILY